MVPVVTSRGGASRRRRLLLLLLLVASAALCSAVTIRVFAFHSLDLANLVWNLFLAWIPFVVALALYDAARRGASTTMLLALGERLAGLPAERAVHRDRPEAISATFRAGRTGTTRSSSGARQGSGSCSGSSRSTSCRPSSRSGSEGSPAGRWRWPRSCSSGLGVYLGRYERWNSWEVLTEPGKIFGGLASGLADPMAYSKPIALSAFFAVSCCAGYAVFYSLFGPHLRRLDER